MLEVNPLIRFLDKTTIRNSPNSYPIEEDKGATVTRSCMLNLDSRITATILWYHNSDTVLVNSPKRKLLNGNQTLRFEALETLNDQGVFTCQVFSNAGNATRSYNISVIEVPQRPTVQAELSSTARAIEIRWQKPYDGNRLITGYNIRYRMDGKL